jgi:hypothetical protein
MSNSGDSGRNKVAKPVESPAKNAALKNLERRENFSHFDTAPTACSFPTIEISITSASAVQKMVSVSVKGTAV